MRKKLGEEIDALLLLELVGSVNDSSDGVSSLLDRYRCLCNMVTQLDSCGLISSVEVDGAQR